jgi:cytochrome c peroxidase
MLRNISKTSPYMHDGRFWTLRDVVEFYNFHLKPSPTVDNILAPNIGIGLGLTKQNMDDLVYFLEEMLTDYKVLNNPKYANPFD